MSLEDALCVTLLSGVRDARLKDKQGEFETPILPAFGVLIDAAKGRLVPLMRVCPVGMKLLP